MKLGYSLIFLVTLSACAFAMDNPYLVPHAFGPVTLNNFSGYPIQVKIKRIIDYDISYKTYPIIIPNGQSLTFESLRVLPGLKSNIESLKDNARSRSDIYQMSVSYYGTYFTPTEYELVPRLQKEAESCRGNSIAVSVTTKSYWGSSSLEFAYSCGKEPRIQQDWQFLEDEKIKSVPATPSFSPFLVEDIIRLHPGWTAAEAKIMLETTARTEAAAFPQFFADEKAFRDNKASETNTMNLKFNQLVELAKKEGFLKPNATIKRTPEANPRSVSATDDVNSSIVYSDGYFHFLSPLYASAMDTGRFAQDYEKLLAVSKESAQLVGKNVANVYKIHLMPSNSWNELLSITSRFLNALMSDPELQKLIGGFKVRAAPIIQTFTIMPFFVIYIFQGTQVAQKVLDKVVALFNGVHGLGLPPRYNGSVNDLIFVAQGNGEEKETYPRYFEEPRKIYFKSTFPGPREQNYHLKNPLTGVEIVQ